jgi:hypothetical protein
VIAAATEARAIAAGRTATATTATATAAAPPPPRPNHWEYTVRLPSLAAGYLDVELRLHGLGDDLQLCADMPRGGAGVRDLKTAAGVALAAVPDDPDCWDLPDAAPGQPADEVFRYRYDLNSARYGHGDPDRVSRAGDSFVFNEGAVLLSPSPMPEDGEVEIIFELPEGVSVSPPWPKLSGAPWRFSSTARQHAAGSYVALGRLRALEEVRVPGGVFTITLVDLPRRAPDAVLHAWVAKAAKAVAGFYQTVPEGRVHVILVPVEHATEPDVFGTTLNRAAPSVVMFLGAEADPESFAPDWMATHEIFHVGNPRARGRLRWLNEGSATYYQEVLRGRAAMASPEKVWGSLYDGFHRFCDPDPGASLRDVSEGRKRRAYMQLYWSGACLFFRADVAIREHSQGKRSLDDVLRDLRQRGIAQPVSEAEVLATLDREAGAPVASSHLDAKAPIPLAALFKRLGIEPTGKDTVRLHDEAKGAAIRKAILAPMQ